VNSFGRVFRISIAGESHGELISVMIDGAPPGLELSKEDFLSDIKRRKAGKKGTTARVERDIPEILSGVFNGRTTGAPILIKFENSNVVSKDYAEMKLKPRPGHADFTASKKYDGFNDYRGGGHFSGRLTLALVAAGVIAKKIIEPVKITANLVNEKGSEAFERDLNAVLKAGDSIGGVVECTASNIPIGIGEPFFDSVESMIGHIVFSIPGVKGVEFGAGFALAGMRGFEANDLLINIEGRTATNFAGGVCGGITNGNDMVFRVAVKPTSSIGGVQQTINLETGEKCEIKVGGRHDACIALRVPVILEAVTAIVLADFICLQKSSQT